MQGEYGAFPGTMRRLFLFLVLIGAANLRTFAGPSQAEAQAEFASADKKLNQAWGEVKNRFSGEVLEELKEQQKAWVTFRDERAESAASVGQGEEVDPKKTPAYFLTAAKLSVDRAACLLRLAKGEDEPLTGIWIDGTGGTIDIVERDGRLYFDFNVVRTQAFNLGALAGTASWNTPLGWFSDKGRDAGKADETNMAFILRGQRLEIVTANADSYHGNRAYFDGRYFKVASLDAGEQTAVVKSGETGISLAEQ
jgi:uncharacterized protein YecT (DUF1311 family)